MKTKSISAAHLPKSVFSCFSPFVQFFLLSLVFLSLSRLLLMSWQIQRIAGSDSWSEVFLQGIRIDISSLCWLLALPVLASILFSGSKTLSGYLYHANRCYLTLVLTFIVFMEVATPAFILEYDLRPNRLFLEYLDYPKEVFSMLARGHLFSLVCGGLALIISGYFGWRWTSKLFRARCYHPGLSRYLAGIFMVLVVFLGARSTLGHRPINPAMVYFSNDPLVNALILNSAYSVAFAAKQLAGEVNSTELYGQLSEEVIIDNIRTFKQMTPEDVVDDKLPSLSKQRATYRGPKKNLVIILQESLGARFVGSLGGLPLTPNLDSLSRQAWTFNNMFATGTRSVRGIEAVMTGFTPTPDRAVVKRDKSQSNFFTLAELLKRQGYYTQFIYGGESHFDNMKSFFLGNGVTDIHDLDKFTKPNFIGSWGASDEDLFNEADKSFTRLHQNRQPFFSFVFTSSNHDPFEFPEKRITPLQYSKQEKQEYGDKELARHRAIQYADYSLGQFFEKAKKSDYYQDTVFLVIADHDARAFGQDLVPIQSFHIPALILGQDITPKQSQYIASQIDMAPTLLSLIGVDNENPMLGRDLTRVAADYQGRAMMQYADNFALLEHDEVTILQPGKPASFFDFERSSFRLSPATVFESGREIRALSLSLWGSLAYHNNLYRLQ
ncbi:LTA synthase family protein [Thalassomonas sp. RHCl1]|uniref:LTA synthase family protein n=1 Tax=Thalassomonas sp. RHCl1 TaxID=2995320 RepID=UPI00248B23BF|nr:LTA synthase family protein [Thalassomonas sp. RHCl1]